MTALSINRRQDIQWWMLNIFAFSVPLSSFVSVRLLVLATVFGLFAGNLREMPRKLARNAWDLMLFIATLMLGLIYTANLGDGVRILETSFSLLALPIVLASLQDVSDARLRTVFLFFQGGLVLAGLICVTHSVVTFSEGNTSSFFSYNLTDFIQFHPTYFAYYLIFGIGFSLYLLFYNQNKFPIPVTVSSISFCFFLLVLTGGRTAFISLLLIFSFFILKFILEERTANKNVVFILVCVMLVVLFAVNSADSWSQAMIGDYWERTMLWESALKANPSPVFGVGTGDYKDVLNNYYTRHGMEEFAKESYNSHNQFIQTYFTNGLIGLLALLLTLARPLYLAMRSDNALGILLFFPFVIYGMTEVFLGRYQGVVFFAFLHQTFIASLPAVRRVLSLKGGIF